MEVSCLQYLLRHAKVHTDLDIPALEVTPKRGAEACIFALVYSLVTIAYGVT
jgi:hypothetical protein